MNFRNVSAITQGHDVNKWSEDYLTCMQICDSDNSLAHGKLPLIQPSDRVVV